MTAKDKETKSFQDRLKQFFRLSKNNPANVKGPNEFALTEEIERELSKNTPIATRTRTLKNLKDATFQYKLEPRAVERLWVLLQDLFGKEHSMETRHTCICFFQWLIKGQFSQLNIMRAQFFRIIKEHDNPEDVAQMFELFQALTDNGKVILYFEQEVGPFLLNWLPEIIKGKKEEDFLVLLTNIIKFNAAHIDEPIVSGLVQNITMLCCNTPHQTVVSAGLQVLDTIVAYSNLPPDSLPHFVGLLCRTVTSEYYCSVSWRVIRNLLGTHMGHSALYTMCRILQEPSLQQDSSLLRGAVFFIKMGLWGAQFLPNLRAPPNSILPSILYAAKSNHAAVLYEITLCVQQLVQKLGVELYDPAWDSIFAILSLVVRQIEGAPELAPNVLAVTHLHETLTHIEGLIESGKFLGTIKRFHQVIEECAHARPESSVLQLIGYLARDIIPVRHLWFSNLNSLLQKYYRCEKRTTIRLRVLGILERVVTLHRDDYEDELIDRIVVPHLLLVVGDADVAVRTAAVELLVNLCVGCESKKCLELLDILEKILFRPFDLGFEVALSASEQADIKAAASGLVRIFLTKIFRLPSFYAVRIYKMLIAFLEHHYNKPRVFEECNAVRYKILESLMRLRADNLYRLGYMITEKKIKYSTYLCVIYRSPDRGVLGSPPPMSPVISQQPACTITHIPVFRAFKLIVTCLKQERDWEVLHLVLQAIPQIMQNKSLILTKHGNNEIGILIDALTGLIADKSLPECLKATVKPHRPEFHIIILMAMASLSSYHSYLDPVQQQKIIRCLVRFGLIPKNSKRCIAALTICALEMRDVMVKMLPEVLLDLSKISATVHIAIPVLEFLSTLAKLSSVYASFVGDQYMAVFAISLPFTNPFKYNHYIVSLAHHVIAVWFLKCRLPFRRDFISYITKGLQTNVLLPFEERSLMRADLNENSADRKRSSSLSEGCSRGGRGARSSTVRADLRPAIDTRSSNGKSLAHFYEELTETCIDLMARYTFSSYNDIPRRSATAEFILGGGHSMTWLLGTKLVTVTTSSCSQKALKYGLCEKCWVNCRVSNYDPFTEEGEEGGNNSNRVTRQNSAEKSNTNTSASSPLDENKRFSDKLDQLPSKLQQLKTTDGRKSVGKQLCVCWCQGWAEIYVRRPTGDMAWTMRIQNTQPHHQHLFDFPLNEIATVFAPIRRRERPQSVDILQRTDSEETGVASSAPISIPGTPSRQSSRDSMDDDMEMLDDGTGKSRNPVRRSNSSPEMSASWKNPFMMQKQQQQEHDDPSRANDDETTKKTKPYTKDMRVSCEAIPEEMGATGTTPPSAYPIGTGRLKACESQPAPLVDHHHQPHPSLLSYHSYPGSTPPKEHPKGSKTVPPSPNILHTNVAPPLAPKRKLDEKVTDGGVGNLANLPSLAPLSSKPPQTPPQTSPSLARRVINKEGHEIQKSSSANLERAYSLNRKEKKAAVEKVSQDSSSQRRDRCNTISIMTPAQNSRHSTFSNSNRQHDFPRSANNPSFVFLQLYHSAQFGYTDEKPLRISSSQGIQRSLRVLDCVPPYETHRIGVIYVGEEQSNDEVAILRNSYGSMRYIQFLQDLGTLIKLDDADPQMFFLGGLDQNGEDGKFTYIWQDDVIRVVFHISTLMPLRESDPNCNNKKKHIGNNNVTIVYNESGEDYDLNTITGQFNYACIIIHPLDHNTNKVVVKVKDELGDLIGDTDPKVVTDQNVALLARQLALHADLGSLVSRSLKTQSQNPYASNWLERLRRIKNIKTKVAQETNTEQASSTAEPVLPRKIEDFSEYT